MREPYAIGCFISLLPPRPDAAIVIDPALAQQFSIGKKSIRSGRLHKAFPALKRPPAARPIKPVLERRRQDAPAGSGGQPTQEKRR